MYLFSCITITIMQLHQAGVWCICPTVTAESSEYTIRRKFGDDANMCRKLSRWWSLSTQL